MNIKPLRIALWDILDPSLLTVMLYVGMHSMHSIIAELIGGVRIDFHLSGGCSFIVRGAAFYRPVTLSITRADLHFKWYNRHFLSHLHVNS